ncbi:hypothetical protein PoMZ_13731 [Pyricularia oryzae]|uniref:Uncharacterized protein n=1 Tax=Pyricularia oryzae TaxID=318829 RepID=A0A4P7NVS7_PYROR|nr:hypothetical protein PoMZ_13731 [Pyricularia oryzae]
MESSLHSWLGSLTVFLFTQKELHMLEIAIGIIKAKYPSFEVPSSPQEIYPDLDYFNDLQVSTTCSNQMPGLTEIVAPVLHNYLSPDAAIDSSMFQDYVELLSFSLPNKYFIENPRVPDHAVPDKVIHSAKALRRRSLPLIKLQPQALEQNSSGWFVLHSMQRILAGQPFVDFSDLTASVRETALTHFKCEVLAATKARTLKPNEEDFANLVPDADRTEFFDNAIYAMDDLFVTDHSDHSPDFIKPASGHMVDNALSVAQDASQNRHGALLVVKDISESRQDSSSSSSSQYATEIKFRRRRSRRPSQTLDYRRTILRNISKAVQCYRSTHLSTEMSVPLLWSILEGDPSHSAFLRRYTLILFYMKMSRLDDAGIKKELAKVGNVSFSIKDNSYIRKMRKKQEEGKAWSDLCDLRSDWGQDKYTLLSAVPEDIREAPIEEVSQGIRSENSVLFQSLNDARSLCAALLGDTLPKCLLIDNYSYKDSRLSTHDIKLSFQAFLSLDPSQPNSELLDFNENCLSLEEEPTKWEAGLAMSP